MNTTPDHPDTEPLHTDPATDTLEATDSGIAAVPAAPARRRRRALWIALATVALAAVATAGTVAITTAVERTEAAAAFEKAVSDRVDAYAAQDAALTALGDAEYQAFVDYTQLLTIATTLTDSTVEDPATGAAVLDSAAALAQTAWLELDENGHVVAEQTPVLTGLTPSTPITAPAPAEDLDALAAQTTNLNDDTDAVISYTDLATGVTADITTATDSGRDAVDTAMESAAAKGATLVYDRAPTETATVTAAAAALITDEAWEAPLEEKSALVQGYITAVNAAAAQQQAVLAAEQAEADRLAAEEQQRQSQNSTRNGTRNGGTKPGGSTGGSNPGSGGSNPGNGGSNPGNGGGSNWRPLEVRVTGSTCSGSGAQVTYGSVLNVPGTNLDTYSTYEIPGYGWGATWKCKYW